MHACLRGSILLIATCLAASGCTNAKCPIVKTRRHWGRRWTLLLLLGLVPGCNHYGTPLRYTLDPQVRVAATGHFRAGVAKTDITPPPGYSTLGYGPSGRHSRGFWTRLWARATYLDDGNGNAVALVACDLDFVGGGLIDRAVELLQDFAQRTGNDPPPLGRHQIVVAGTHTHHGPGNLATAVTYNFGGGRGSGFDRDLFNYVAHQIARAIREAQKAAEPASLRYWSRMVPGIARNRMYVAFMLNPEANEIKRAARRAGLFPMTTVGGTYDPQAYLAVRPRISVLDIRSEVEGRRGRVIGRTVVFPTHPTVLDYPTEVYSSDFFGVAAYMAETAIKRSNQGHRPMVSIFNGAEGDVHAAFEVRDRREVLMFARRLAREIIEPIDPVEQIDTQIRWRAELVPIANACLDTRSSGRDEGDAFERCTADRPLNGVAAVGGGIDGRTFLHDAGWKDGVVGDRRNREIFHDQGIKQPALDLYMELPLSLTGLIQKPRDVAERAIVGIYQIGPIALATLPGEFTTTMGWRIERNLEERLEPEGIEDVVILGLAHEYVSYVTTPEEYEAQTYEGASTLYGPVTGPLVMEHLNNVAKKGLQPAPPQGAPTRPALTSEHLPGGNASFTLADAGEPPTRPDAGLGHLVQDLRTREPARDYPTACWSEQLVRNLKDMRKQLSAGDLEGQLDSVNPLVRVRYRYHAGPWKLDGDNRGIRVVTVASERFAEKEAVWCAIWMPPPRLHWQRLEVEFDVTGIARDAPTRTLTGRRDVLMTPE